MAFPAARRRARSAATSSECGARASFLGLALFLGLRERTLLRDLFLVEVAERPGFGIERRATPLSLAIDEVVERDDARQLRDVARERAHVVVGAGDLDLDRQLGVEVLPSFPAATGGTARTAGRGPGPPG